MGQVTGQDPCDGPSDAALVARVLAGDKAAFGDLVGRYERVIGALCRQKIRHPADAEDVCQEAFLKAFRGLASLKEHDRFGPWLYGIAFRASIDHHRRRKRSGRIVSLDHFRQEGGPDPTAEGEGGADAALRREEAERVLAALEGLGDKYRLVLTLRYQRHMSYKAIAEHLGEPGGTIANRIHRAIRLLKERLKAEVA